MSIATCLSDSPPERPSAQEKFVPGVERYLDGAPFSLQDLFRGTPPTFKLPHPLVIGAEEWVDRIVALLR